MEKKKALKIGGLAAIAAGVVAVYFGGGSEGEVVSVVGLVFTGIGLLVDIIGNVLD